MWKSCETREEHVILHFSFWVMGQQMGSKRRKRKLMGKITSVCGVLSLRFQWDCSRTVGEKSGLDVKICRLSVSPREGA